MVRPKGPRARFLADHLSATQKNIPNIENISAVKGDGEFFLTYSHPRLSPPSSMRLQVIPQEYSSYPSEHLFLVLVADDYDIPPAMSAVLEEFLAASSGMKVHDALEALSRDLTASLEQQSEEGVNDDEEDTVMTDVGDDQDESSGDEEFDDFDFIEDHDDHVFGLGISGGTAVTPTNIAPETLSRIRRDLITLRNAGFKVGRVCGFDSPGDTHIVSASIRVDKLCLSEETRDAWNLKTRDFIILLMRYSGSYISFDDALELPAGLLNLAFCLRKCEKYKPSVTEAIKAFAQAESSRDSHEIQVDDKSGLGMLGVAQSIDTFMNSDFIPMLKLRLARQITWDAAKKELHSITRTLGTSHTGEIKYAGAPGEALNAHDAGDRIKLPAFIANEHILSSQEKSLPLVAAQFAMRYLLRCTEYCMICHQQVDGNFEALKPYVCNDSLCLFQYMAMGFGPSIELEVMNHPSVVDLLINFCYSGLQKHMFPYLRGSGVREFPTGMNLQVPGILPGAVMTDDPTFKLPASSTANYHLRDPIPIAFDLKQSLAKLENAKDIPKLQEGKWVVIVFQPQPDRNLFLHCRIEALSRSNVYLRIASQHLIPPDPTKEIATEAINKEFQAHMVLYNQNLDDLTVYEKAFAMSLLLASTPSVKSMRQHVTANTSHRLDKWERLTPAAAKLLRWIISSNRSYIVQVGDHPDFSASGAPRANERIGGLGGWLQFRFAQGSPEKEVQFLKELKTVDKPQKTILAWHGSSMSNWHSIIREGLDFKEIQNGRSFGNGVYFAKDLNTSLGYCASYHGAGHGQQKWPEHWPNSTCPITTAVTLNEIVNMPDQFQHQSSIYVVQHTHWIQCRYLLVKPRSELESESDKGPRTESPFVQDPEHEAVAGGHKRIFVPKCSIPSAQEESTTLLVSLRHEAAGHSGDSDEEDPDDIRFLYPNEDELAAGEDKVIKSHGTAAIPVPENDNTAVGTLEPDKTDFHPGSLDLSTVPQLAPPAYATAHAQTTIQREIKKLQKIQANTPVHELGWYIDFNSLTNMFQWIVELHSFDEALPLAKDMRKRDITSIILELRFGRDYPLSPPFVRVVRPRFLPFGVGGGGHVTGGGAMCMQLLTNSGWTPANSMESVLLQVRMALCNLEPNPARLAPRRSGGDSANSYNISEAYEAYRRSAHDHGWSIPTDIKEAVEGMTAEDSEQ